MSENFDPHDGAGKKRRVLAPRSFDDENAPSHRYVDPENMQDNENPRPRARGLGQSQLRERISAEQHQFEIEQSQQEIARLQIEQLSQELELAKQRLTSYRSQVLEGQTLKEELHRSQLRVQELEAQVTLSIRPEQVQLREGVAERESLERTIRNYEAELRTLRQRSQNFELMEEELLSLRHTVQRQEAAVRQAATLQAQYTTLQQQHASWMEAIENVIGEKTVDKENPSENASSSSKGNVSISSLLVYIQNLQTARLHALQQHADSQLTIKKQQLQLSENERKLSELQATQTALQAELEETKKNLKKSNHRLIFVTKERDGLKDLLASYEEEENMKDKTNNNGGSGRSAHQQELENALRSAQAHISELEKENVELESLRVTNQKLERTLQQTEQELATLETRLGRGEFDPKKTKVLHLSMNPATEAAASRKQQEQDRLIQLTQQVESLTQQLQQATSLSAANGETTSEVVRLRAVEGELKALLQQVQDENENLKRQLQEASSVDPAALADAEKKYQRLKELYSKMFAEYKEAVYLLTGYKIDRVGQQPLYRLRSIYAETEDDHILFQVDERLHCEVLETEFCRRLDDGVLSFLHRFHSIPAFLSQITLDLFNKQTFSLH